MATQQSTNPVALIDGDILVYRNGFAAQKKSYVLSFDGGVATFDYKKELNSFVKEQELDDYEIEELVNIEPVENALALLRNNIRNIVENVGVKEYVVFLTPPGGTVRDRIAEYVPYKGNRKDAPKPVHYDAMRQYIMDNHPYIMEEQTEADDMIGVLASETSNPIICSIDKDLDIIPGLHYHFVNDYFYEIDEEDGDFCLYKQMLTGDVSDNIKGVSGVGDKTAEKLLRHLSPDEWEEEVYKIYTEEFGSEAPFRWEENYYLLRICKNREELNELHERGNT